MMEERAREVLNFVDSDEDMGSEDDSSSVDSDYAVKCVKIELDEHIAAFKDKRELIRDTEAIPCNSNLVEDVTTNYIIAKQIISNLAWQEKMLCAHVCSTWQSAVQALQKEQMSPEDFVINIPAASAKGGKTFVQSGTFYTEPLVVMTFANTTGLCATSKCEYIVPCPCKEPCEKIHCLLDLVNHKANTPKNRMLVIKSSYISYVPLPHSITYQHTVMHLKSKPFLGGLFIPMIPGVEFHTIHVGTTTKEGFNGVVQKISETRIFKGILVYITEKFLLETVEDIVFLNYFKELQPDIPYALGGCIIEETFLDESNIDLIIHNNNDSTEFISDNVLSIGVFTVPKISENKENNFDMFSLILESSDWSKPKIQQSINEFSKQVPKFEHSVAIKLSCVGRDQKHKLEQDLFRAAFPHTRIVGCYGNGELGLNHPPKPTPLSIPNAAKRHRHDPGPQYGIMYSYSTVFVYIGWGKILSNPTKPSSSQ
ncbi:uncharacterized protein [Epargyreus clarus]|uniref:uncharacterized protein n=1 Tax=Epargyreus clarus TaxID=520877 RepID=UPI003C2B47C9